MAAASRRISGLTLFYSDCYEVMLPKGHRFPMDKYRRTREAVQAFVKRQQFDEHVHFEPSPFPTTEEIATTHCPEYWQRFTSNSLTRIEQRNIGFPWTPELVKRTLASTGGTLAAARMAMNSGFGGQLAGGTHHAFYDRGEGFCVLNDIALSCNVLLSSPSVSPLDRIMIVDLDVHQGNGTARLFASDDRVFTWNAHCGTNVFSKLEKSDCDIVIPPGSGDEEYLDAIESHLKASVDAFQPQLIFYQAGVDVLGNDRLGKLNLSRIGLQKRNQLVFDCARKVGSPLVVTMGGGYGHDTQDTVDAHADVYIALIEEFLKL